MDARKPQRQTGGQDGRPAARFGEYLRQERRSRNRSVEEIASVTRIPERSLHCLESGDLDRLPADVFVRGFVRAYAQTIGLDPDDTLRRYAACGRPAAPVSTAPSPVELGLSASPIAVEESTPIAALRRAARGTRQPPKHNDLATVPPAPVPVPVHRRVRSFLPPMLRGDRESRRGPITLAVIILLIVATLAMSYLLRRPSTSGDGITRALRAVPAELA